MNASPHLGELPFEQGQLPIAAVVAGVGDELPGRERRHQSVHGLRLEFPRHQAEIGKLSPIPIVASAVGPFCMVRRCANVVYSR